MKWNTFLTVLIVVLAFALGGILLAEYTIMPNPIEVVPPGEQ